MTWLNRLKAPGFSTEVGKKEGFPEGLWKKCPSCAEIMFHDDLVKSFMVCPKCKHHFRIKARDRINIIIDAGTFEELDVAMSSEDPLDFKDLKKYKDRIKSSHKDPDGEKEAFIYGRGKVHGLAVSIGTFVFEYMGGSMGSVVGEKITRTLELALKEKCPAILITASGGARMQEGILSLMQMAKTSAALFKMRKAGIPTVIVLTDPTTGGVAASIAMLGDILIAEPNALIGFAGPRVIEQTIKEKLPEGFQRSEFLLSHGVIDRIVHRLEMKDVLFQLLSSLSYSLQKAP